MTSGGPDRHAVPAAARIRAAEPVVLALRGVRVAYGGRTVLEVPALSVHPREVLAVIGPNGAGKSTLLRVLALLERPTAGSVEFHGLTVEGERARLAARRRMASVFQAPLLCDDSVRANVALALRFRGIGRAEAERRVGPWLARLGIAHLADRPARTLSGGEAQRTSLARAFAAEPEVLFLDEPFAALDPPTREGLLDDFARLLAETRPTTVFVTHDRTEALRLGDRVAVLLEGRLAQLGPPEAVFGAPATEAVARLVGVENLLPGRVVGREAGLLTLTVAGQPVAVVGEAAVGERVLLALRPEDVTLETGAPGASSARNRLAGTVREVVRLGPVSRVVVDCGVRVAAVVTRPSVEALGLAPGVPVTALFGATAAHLVRAREAAPPGPAAAVAGAVAGGGSWGAGAPASPSPPFPTISTPPLA